MYHEVWVPKVCHYVNMGAKSVSLSIGAKSMSLNMGAKSVLLSTCAKSVSVNMGAKSVFSPG